MCGACIRFVILFLGNTQQATSTKPLRFGSRLPLPRPPACEDVTGGDRSITNAEMALSESRSSAPGSEPPQQQPVENGNDGLRGDHEGFENGGAPAVVNEANDDLGIPAVLSDFYSRYDRGNASVRRTLRVREERSKRDGFPRGFSLGRSISGVSKASAGATVSQDWSQDLDTPDFDTERMDKRGESPAYGSAGEQTPEIGSFHLAQETGGEESEAEEAPQLINASVDPVVATKDEPKRHLFSRRKKAVLSGAPGNRKPSTKPTGAKREGYITSRLFAKPLAARDDYLNNDSSPSPDVRTQATNVGGPMGSFEITFDEIDDANGWNDVYPRGERPEPRHIHAAAVVGRRMVVVGGQTASGPSNDVQMLHLGSMSWSELDRGRAFANGPAEKLRAAATPGQQLPPCRGHSLVSWGKTVLLVGGEFTPSSDRVEVWSFDLDTNFWTKIAAKGEVPASRSGQSVTRAGSILIMFGGETSRGQKLNDLHILDLKSLMWLPLHTFGYGPSPRSKHCAAMYDDRFLLIFGGASRSKPLGDLFALDFETMEWCKMKTKGINPAPRSGHAGILIGDKWYIAGGETRGRDYSCCYACFAGSIETLMLDVGNLTWFSVAATSPNTPVANQGLSLVLVQRKEKTVLVAFGGNGSELSNQVQLLYVLPLDPVKGNGPSLVEARDGHSNSMTPYTSGLSCGCLEVAKRHLTPLAEEQSSTRSSLRSSPGTSPLTEVAFDLTGVVPLRRRYGSENGSKHSNGSKYSAGRQTPGEILSRVLSETSSRESSPIQHFKTPETQHSDQELAAPAYVNARRQGSSSRRKGSFDSTLTSVLESSELIDSSRMVAMHADLNARTQSLGSESSASLYSAVQSLRWEGEESSDSQLLADLQDAMTMERRIHLINKYRQNFEMKLAAAVRRSEQAEGHLTAVLRGRGEAERELASAVKTRQQAEGKLAAALKVQMELKERVAVAEVAQADANNLCNVVHAENLRLEHDLAFLKAVLEDTQKELQSTREVLATERARSFQLQMEVSDLKKRSPRSAIEVLSPSTATASQLSPVAENAGLVIPD